MVGRALSRDKKQENKTGDFPGSLAVQSPFNPKEKKTKEEKIHKEGDGKRRKDVKEEKRVKEKKGDREIKYTHTFFSGLT